jgi:hypothetical protein
MARQTDLAPIRLSVALACAVTLWSVARCTTAAPPTTGPLTTASSVPSASESAVPSASASSSSLAAVTWKDYSVQKPEPFRISLPDTWQAIDASQLADSETLSKLQQQNPNLAAILRTSIDQMRSGGISFVAIDPQSASTTRPFADNLNVVPPKGQVTADRWDEFVRQSAIGIQQALKLAKPPSATGVSLPNAQRGAELIYTYELAMPTGEKLVVAVQQYLILAKNKPFVLSMSTTQDQQAARRDLFTEIANRFKPG